MIGHFGQCFRDNLLSAHLGCGVLRRDTVASLRRVN